MEGSVKQAMTRVTMVLARGPDRPNGDLDDRLVVGLALTRQGQVDLEAYYSAAEPWLAWHGRRDGEARPLELVRIDEGWALQSTDSEDDPIITFDGHIFRPGELVRLCRGHHEEYLFRIVAADVWTGDPVEGAA